ncbi:hypothetical protein BDZ45DRAFT_723817 [Acephala macrosclerotiorum]|nr:hypothetical protein BDZ45DRAFT_723817 [Acephala macrosclerotiorum]
MNNRINSNPDSLPAVRPQYPPRTVMEDWYFTTENIRQADYSGGKRNTTQATQATSSASGWQFLVGPITPTWPRRYDETPLQSDFAGQTLNAFTGSTWDLLDDALWNATAWEQWDKTGESDSPATEPSFASSNSSRSNTFARNSQLWPGLEPETDSVAGSNGQRVPLANHDNIPYTICFESIPDPSNNTIGKRNHATAYRASRTALHRTISPKLSVDWSASGLTLLPPSADLTEPPPRPTDKRYHKDTERQYRSRLNNAFSVLLNATPEGLVVAATGVSGNGQEEKAATKMEILDFAKTHITSLETRRLELEEESLLLRGQVALSKSIVLMLGAFRQCSEFLYQPYGDVTERIWQGLGMSGGKHTTVIRASFHLRVPENTSGWN